MFDLDAYLKARRETVHRFLDGVLPRPDERPRALHEAMRYAVLSGGKRLRPILCFAAAEAIGSPCLRAVHPAAALELFHAYTLVHDDLPAMDNDDLRRGRPTCHRVFGEADAILAGDALLTLAFQVLAEMPDEPAGAPARLVGELSRAGGSRGVAGGQVEDLAHADNALDATTIEFIHAHKTADLFAAAARMGAIAAGGAAEQILALGAYGHALGMAFQIVDDLMDAGIAAPREASCVAVYGEAGARRRAAEFTGSARNALRGFGDAGAPLDLIATRLLDRSQ